MADVVTCGGCGADVPAARALRDLGELRDDAVLRGEADAIFAELGAAAYLDVVPA